ncbi:putative sensor with HAMP domain [Parafrankia sp. EAN1pec]|nr:putative sensor with HAMP domain [Frankia sp. EAN1pec]
MRRQPMASSTGMAADRPPMTAAGSSVEDEDHHDDRPPTPPRPERSGGRSLRHAVTDPTNWRVRTKLIAILAVPIVAILVNSSIQAASVLTSTRDVNRVRDLIEISRSASTLVYSLQQERTFTTGLVARTGSLPAVESRRAAVNDAYTAYQNVTKGRAESFGPEVRDVLEAADNRLSRLDSLRQASVRMVDPGSVRAVYKPLIDSLIDLVVRIPQGNDDQQLLTSVTATDHLVRANEELAVEQALVHGVAISGRPFTTEDYREFLSTYSQRVELLRAFEEDATPAELTIYRDKLNSDENNDIENTALYTEQVLNAPVGQPLEVIDSEKWLRATKETIDLGTEVTGSLLGITDDRVGELRGQIQRGALLSGLLIVVILASALLAAVVVARSLVRPLLALRTAALDVAGRRLPEAVRRLRDSSDQDISDDVEPIGIDSDEEIGEVARAFDAVHREAVRLASEQAVLRNNVNAMFVNLSRRSQGLVERQLRLIDDLENREQDPDQLANLFKLDHLATRMRRNNESLLVLAGTDTARRWTHPVPVNEVVLAAISEVEQYTRVKQTGAASVSIAGSGVSDVVHLIAELLENATSYSPPVTDVMVSSHSLGPGAGAMIEIEDQGIGMPAKELERVNDRLANPPIVDVSVSRTMGLFAVGRLAGRHGIRVQLRESASGGITAVVRLPAKLVTGDGGAIPSAPRPAAAIGPGSGGPGGQPGGREAVARGGSSGLALPRGSDRNGAGSGLPTTNFSPTVDPAASAAAGGSSLAPSSNGTGTGPGFGQGFGQGPGQGFGQGPGQGSGFGQGQGLGQAFGQRQGFGQGPPSGGSPDTGPVSLFGGGGGQSDGPARNGHHPGNGPDERMLNGSGQPRREETDPFPTQGQTGPEDSAEFALEAFDSGPLPQRLDGQNDVDPHTGEHPYTYPMAIGRGGEGDEPEPERADTGGYLLPDAQAEQDEYSAQVGPPTGPTSMYAEPETDALSRPGGVFNRAPARPSPDQTGPFPRTGPNLAAAFRTPRETGPLEQPVQPRAEDTGELAAAEQGEDVDTTPIFDSVSAWFQRRSPAPSNGSSNGQGERRGQRPTRGPVRAQGAGQQPPATRQAPPAQQPIHQVTPLPQRPQPSAPVHRTTQPPAVPRTPARGEPIVESPARGIRRPGLGAPLPGAPVPAGAAQAPRQTPQTGPQPVVSGGQPPEGSWSSAGDAGWKAAEQLRQPSAGGTTRSGLPVRVPMTHLVPGSAEPAASRRPPEPTTRSPEVVGGRLASFYQGVRQGRDVGTDTTRNPRRDVQEER